MAAGDEPDEEWGAGAGLQAEAHSSAGQSPHPTGSPARQASGTWDELLGCWMGPAAS